MLLNMAPNAANHTTSQADCYGETHHEMLHHVPTDLAREHVVVRKNEGESAMFV